VAIPLPLYALQVELVVGTDRVDFAFPLLLFVSAGSTGPR
jgi:hypothetical protein